MSDAIENRPAGELWAERVDLGSIANVLRSRANQISEDVAAISDELRRRNGDLFDITDHAVLQYLKRVRGLDIEAVRKELSDVIAKAVPAGALKSDAEAYVSDGLVFVVARRRLVVTVYPADNPIASEILETQKAAPARAETA